MDGSVGTILHWLDEHVEKWKKDLATMALEEVSATVKLGRVATFSMAVHKRHSEIEQ